MVLVPFEQSAESVMLSVFCAALHIVSFRNLVLR